MGLIRKTLFVGTGGFVSPNSKKQRQANKQIRLQKQMLKSVQQQQQSVVRAAPRVEPEEDATGLTDVVIVQVDPRRKVQTIKIVREATDVPLVQAKRIVDTREVIECSDEEEAVELRAALEGAGALIELRGHNDERGYTRAGTSVAELERLAKLHAQGHLTDEEFTAAKAKVLR